MKNPKSLIVVSTADANDHLNKGWYYLTSVPADDGVRHVLGHDDKGQRYEDTSIRKL